MRRRRGGTPAKPFDGAWGAINKLEAAVVNQMVPMEFTLKNVVDFLWPAETVEKLTKAWPLYKAHYEMNAMESVYFDLGGKRIMGTINLCCKAANMICPKEGMIENQPMHDKGILRAMSEAYAIHRKFEDVRTVVRWLNEHCTPGAARNYFPPILSLLPTGHAVHDAGGDRYREPTADMTEIAPLMRETAPTIISALMAELSIPSRPNFRVAFNGTRNCKNEYGRDVYVSEYFGFA